MNCVFNTNLSTFNYPSRQYFSLPFGIISYITQNPKSAIGLLKLQKTCKYFFTKNKIIIVDKRTWLGNNELMHDTFTYIGALKNVRLSGQNGVKYWLTKELTNFWTNQKYPIKIPNYIYRSNLETLTIINTNLTLNEANFFMDGGKITHFDYYLNKSEPLLLINEYLKKIPKVKYFYYNCEKEIFTNETFEKMCNHKFETKQICFHLCIWKLSPEADITLLCKFVKHICGFFDRTADFYFTIKMENSQEYKLKLQAAVEDLESNLGDRIQIS